MKRIALVAVIFVLFICAIIVGMYHWFQTGSTKKFTTHSLLKNGDLVLRRGKSMESFAVYIFDKNRDYSHIGIVAIDNNKPYIIHIVPDKPDMVRKDTPEEFLSDENASHFLILRPDFSQQELKSVANSALQFYTDKLIFDNNYSIQSDSALYCTELVIKAFKKNNITFPDIVPQKLKLILGTYQVIMPGAFIENSHFTGLLAG
jgi:hypothetical protein